MNASAFPVANRSLFHSGDDDNDDDVIGELIPRPLPRVGVLTPPLSLRLDDNGVVSVFIDSDGEPGKVFDTFFLRVLTFKLGSVTFCVLNESLGPPAVQDMPLSFVMTLERVGEAGSKSLMVMLVVVVLSRAGSCNWDEKEGEQLGAAWWIPGEDKALSFILLIAFPEHAGRCECRCCCCDIR